MKNIDPKTYDNRFWRFTFLLLIQVLIIMSVAAGLVIFSEFNIVVMLVALGGCGTFMVILIYLAIAQITVMREQMRVELHRIYGKDLEGEIDKEFTQEITDAVDEETTIEGEGGAEIGTLFDTEEDN